MWPVRQFRKWQFNHFQTPKYRANRKMIFPRSALHQFLLHNGPATRDELCQFFYQTYEYDSWGSCRASTNKLIAQERERLLVRVQGDTISLVNGHSTLIPSEIVRVAAITLLMWVGILLFTLNGLTSTLLLFALSWVGLCLAEVYDGLRILKLPSVKNIPSTLKNGSSLSQKESHN